MGVCSLYYRTAVLSRDLLGLPCNERHRRANASPVMKVFSLSPAPAERLSVLGGDFTVNSISL